MSTTPSAEVAVFYAGKGEGSIFVVEFSMASRGANIAFLSQFPHECELLFPPFTLLECKGHAVRGGKRLVLVEATVSTNLPDAARNITHPDTVPGTTPELVSAAILKGMLAKGRANTQSGSIAMATVSSTFASYSASGMEEGAAPDDELTI